MIAKRSGRIMDDRFRFRVWNKEKKILHSCNLPFYFVSKSDEFVLEQCTGLKDKNGRLIYEGDIVRPISRTDEDIHGIIRFGKYDTNYGLFIKWKGKFVEETRHYPGWRKDILFWTGDGIEVLGNIHENPELVEGQKL